jgi:hypothetical protein
LKKIEIFLSDSPGAPNDTHAMHAAAEVTLPLPLVLGRTHPMTPPVTQLLTLPLPLVTR